MFTTLASLPRDARDTLFLLAVILWVVLPQVSHLPVWCNTPATSALHHTGRCETCGNTTHKMTASKNSVSRASRGKEARVLNI